LGITVLGDSTYAWRAGLPRGPVDLSADVPVPLYGATSSGASYWTISVHVTGDNSPGGTTPGTLTVGLAGVGSQPIPDATVDRNGNFSARASYAEHPGYWSITIEGHLAANRQVSILKLAANHWRTDYAGALGEYPDNQMGSRGSGDAQLR
ncbi:MAG TPA: hypothetical protein VHF22_11620, partial [Planctomycetota bacterium]|nr:hypothetical protein [Planctomycetota bacterium]